MKIVGSKKIALAMVTTTVKSLLWLYISGLLVSCCNTDIYNPYQQIETIHIKQISSTDKHPAQFYLCGNYRYPCDVYNRGQITSSNFNATSNLRKISDESSVKKTKAAYK
jgi:hypothetical protein